MAVSDLKMLYCSLYQILVLFSSWFLDTYKNVYTNPTFQMLYIIVARDIIPTILRTFFLGYPVRFLSEQPLSEE